MFQQPNFSSTGENESSSAALSARAGAQAGTEKQDLQQPPDPHHPGDRLPQREEAAAKYKCLKQHLLNSANLRDFQTKAP